MKLCKNVFGGGVAAVMLFGLVGRAAASGGTSNVYLMAVNDRVMEMTADNMPMVVGGTLYVPYTMLSGRISGINLGVSAQYSPSRQTVLVSSGQRAVTFDPRGNTAFDLDNNVMDARAVMRNSMVFLPLDWLCGYFGKITYSTPSTPYGTLVRITNSSVILNDDEFVDAADGLLRDNLARYQESVANGGEQASNPVGSNPPASEGPLVYLAFLWGEQGEAVARQLENNRQRGLFLFTGAQLMEQDDAVRRLLGSGHLIGLDLTGGTVEECAGQLEEWSGLLADIARSAAVIVRADGLTAEGRAELVRSGCAVWTATARGADAASGSALLRRLSARQANFVELSCGAEGQSVTSAVLRALMGSEYRLRQTVAPVVQGS